jgi:hypothetical protein
MNKLIKSKIKLINKKITNDLEALRYCIFLAKEIEGNSSDVSLLFNFYKKSL